MEPSIFEIAINVLGIVLTFIILRHFTK